MASVGKNIPHDSARGHVSGTSIFVDDLPRFDGEVIVGFVWSPVAHGRIRSIDMSAARDHAGVVGLFTFNDLDGENLLGPIIQDEPLLAEKETTYIGQPIVVIAAESRKALEEARQLIRLEVDELEPILTIDEALACEEFIGPLDVIRRGDAERAISSAPHRLDGVFRCGGQEQFYLESQAAIAWPDEEDTLRVLSSTQNPSEVQDVIAHVLGLPINKVVVETKRMGGAYGGKECQATHPAAIAALVAHKTKRPARIAYTKDEDMVVTGHRHPFRNHYLVGFDDTGRILGMKVDIRSDGGAYADLSTAVLRRAATHADNAYYIPDVEITARVCRTNNAPNTAFRGFGGPQGVATIECIVQEIAAVLGIDALDVRRVNCYGVDDRNVTPYGQTLENNTLPAIFERLERTSAYRERVEDVRRFNRESRTHLRGIALTPVKFGIAFNTQFLNQANAMVNVYLDGTVQVSTGATEMGQGVNTKILQLVADELGIDMASVRMMITSTEKNNNTSASAASSSADLNGKAAVDAATQIRQRLLPVAARLLAEGSGTAPAVTDLVLGDGECRDARNPARRVSFRELVRNAYHERVNLGARGFYATPIIHFDWTTGTGHPFLYFTNGAAVSEVLIDRFTGMLRITRSDLLMDIGRMINPGIDRGQVTGGFAQGTGWCTTEELCYTDKGELTTHSPTTYKIPNIQDLPDTFNVDFLDNDNTINIRGSKAVGEPPLLLAISVWAAIKHALSFVSGDGVPGLHLPATNEEIVMKLASFDRTKAAAGTSSASSG
jgi:xanthine dehydrogenase large subunit